MSMLEQIKGAMFAARKAREDKVLADLLTTLYSEAAMVGKTKRNGETTDEEVLAVVKKFKEGVIQVIQNAAKLGDQAALAKANHEADILSRFLPQQMSEYDLRDAIIKIVMSTGASSAKDLGKVMSALKAEYLGRYDGSLASRIAKEALL